MASPAKKMTTGAFLAGHNQGVTGFVILGTAILSEDLAGAMTLYHHEKGQALLALVPFLFGGVFVGDSLTYLAGWVLKKFNPFGWAEVCSRRLPQLDEYRSMPLVFLFSRFMPGVRTIIFMLAGFVGYSFTKYALITALSAAIWIAVLTGAFSFLQNWGLSFWVCVAVIFVFFFALRRLSLQFLRKS